MKVDNCGTQNMHVKYFFKKQMLKKLFYTLKHNATSIPIV